MAVGRFARESVAQQSVESVEALAHVGRPERKIHLGRWSQAEHGLGLLQGKHQFAQSSRVKAGPYCDSAPRVNDHFQVGLYRLGHHLRPRREAHCHQSSSAIATFSS